MTFSLGSVQWDSQVFLVLTTTQPASLLTEPRTQQEKPIWMGYKGFGHVELEVNAGIHWGISCKQLERHGYRSEAESGQELDPEPVFRCLELPNLRTATCAHRTPSTGVCRPSAHPEV